MRAVHLFASVVSTLGPFVATYYFVQGQFWVGLWVFAFSLAMS
jgi:hypothetical protein